MTAFPIAMLFTFLLIVVGVLLCLAAISGLVWLLFFIWRRVFAPGQTETRLSDLEYRVDALEDAKEPGKTVDV